MHDDAGGKALRSSSLMSLTVLEVRLAGACLLSSSAALPRMQAAIRQSESTQEAG